MWIVAITFGPSTPGQHLPCDSVPRRRWGFELTLALLGLAGFALRVGYVLAFRRSVVPLAGDAYYYSAGADLIAGGRGFIEPLAASAGHVVQAADHPPLYELWLTIASVVDPGHETWQVTHMLWSCVLGAGSVVFCGLVGRRVAGPRCGLVAAALAVVYPNMWLHDGALLSETMSIFMVSLTLWSAYRFWDVPVWPRAAWLGICCGLAALSRPELILMLPLLLLPLAALVKAVPIRRKLGWLAAGGATALATLAPWVAFNFSRFEEPVYISTNFGSAMAAANCDSTYYGDLIGYKDYACADETFRAAEARTPGWDELDGSQRERQVRREVFRYIGDHVDRLPVVMAARLGRALKVYGVGQEIDYDDLIHGQERWVVYAGLVSWYIVAGLAIAGAVMLRRRREVPAFPLLVVPAITLLAVAAIFAQTRYRAPAEPAVVILAAVAIDAMSRRRRAESPAEADEHPAAEALAQPVHVTVMSRFGGSRGLRSWGRPESGPVTIA
jgi:4-amino-4-deoxy-L-arabinose transferase-like glycosyltransferase